MNNFVSDTKYFLGGFYVNAEIDMVNGNAYRMRIDPSESYEGERIDKVYMHGDVGDAGAFTSWEYSVVVDGKEYTYWLTNDYADPEETTYDPQVRYFVLADDYGEQTNAFFTRAADIIDYGLTDFKAPVTIYLVPGNIGKSSFENWLEEEIAYMTGIHQSEKYSFSPSGTAVGLTLDGSPLDTVGEIEGVQCFLPGENVRLTEKGWELVDGTFNFTSGGVGADSVAGDLTAVYTTAGTLVIDGTEVEAPATTILLDGEAVTLEMLYDKLQITALNGYFNVKTLATYETQDTAGGIGFVEDTVGFYTVRIPDIKERNINYLTGFVESVDVEAETIVINGLDVKPTATVFLDGAELGKADFLNACQSLIELDKMIKPMYAYEAFKTADGWVIGQETLEMYSVMGEYSVSGRIEALDSITGELTLAGEECVLSDASLDTEILNISGYSTGGDAEFFLDGKASTFHALRSGSISDGETTFLEKEITVEEGKRVSFECKIDSEEGKDMMKFYLDGVEKDSISGLDPRQGVYYKDDFEGDIEGWSDTRTSACDNSTILGGYEIFQTVGAVNKTFIGAKRGPMTIKFDYYFIDYWLGGAYLHVNGQEVWTHNHYTDAPAAEVVPIENVGSTIHVDYVYHAEVPYDNTGGDETIVLEFSADNSGWSGVWGIDNVMVESPWTEIAVFVPEGTHTLKWEYSKDDEGSSGNDAAWIDNVLIEDVSLEFDGTADYAVIPDLGTVTNLAMSVTAETGFSDPSSGDRTLLSTFELAGKNELTLQWNAAADDLVLNGFDNASAPFSIPTGVGYDVSGRNNYIVTYDGTTLRIYVNGEEAASGDVSLNVPAMGAWQAGRRSGTNDDYFLGSMEDIFFFGRVLDTGEISALQSGSKPSDMTGYSTQCRGWWQLADGENTTLLDASPAGNDAAIYGAAWEFTELEKDTFTPSSWVEVTVDGKEYSYAELKDLLGSSTADIMTQGAENLTLIEDGWQFIDTRIECVTLAPALYVSGKLEKIDIADGTMTIDGMEVAIPAEVYIDNEEVTDLEELRAKLRKARYAGYYVSTMSSVPITDISQNVFVFTGGRVDLYTIPPFYAPGLVEEVGNITEVTLRYDEILGTSGVYSSVTGEFTTRINEADGIIEIIDVATGDIITTAGIPSQEIIVFDEAGKKIATATVEYDDITEMTQTVFINTGEYTSEVTLVGGEIVSATNLPADHHV
ncbi:MAG: LamG domain-containing protein, partial [Candidatus Omnitrophota bacterium]